MMGTKIGTQTFAKAGSQKPDFKDPMAGAHYTSATQNAVTGGKDLSGGNTQSAQASDKNVGDILNQVANPGGKDPNRTQRKSHNTLDKDDFLKLMLTQMKNQDPMNPMQSHEMAAQLAQFTSLEQLYNVNKNLEGLSKGQDPMQKYEALIFWVKR